jgi:hypothetical protein
MDTIPDGNGYAQWFLLFVALFWVGSVSLMSLTGGWHRLASRFRDSAAAQGETLPFVSMYLRTGGLPVGYRGCVNVTITPRGMRLSILILFRLLHPPMFIPWTAVESVRPEDFGSLRYIAVVIRGSPTRLLFTEAVGRKVQEAFEARYSTMTA